MNGVTNMTESKG